MNNYMKTIISGLKQWVSSQKSDWNQNDSSAANFIKNRPFYSEEKEKVLFSETIETVYNNGFGIAEIPPMPCELNQKYNVEFNNVAYTCKAYNNSSIDDGYPVLLGNLGMVNDMSGLGATDTGEPFLLMTYPEEYYQYNAATVIFTQTEGTHSLSISSTVEEVHQIDKKFVPMPDLADVAHTGDYYDLQNTPYIPWDTVRYGTTQSLTEGNKKIARNNIGAAAAADVSTLNTTVSNLSTLVGDTTVSTQIEDATDECITGLSVSGKVITYTKGDGSTGKITTQDTNTTYNISNGKGSQSIAGFNCLANGLYSFAFGQNAHAIGGASHAKGSDTTAHGAFSHAEGSSTAAYGSSSHAEGTGSMIPLSLTGEANATEFTTSINFNGVKIGGRISYNNDIYKIINKTESTIVLDRPLSSSPVSNLSVRSHYSGAYGSSSHVEGLDTIAASNYQHVQGKHNIEDSADKYAHIVGNGSFTSRSNAHTLDWNGVGWFAGGLKVGGTSQDDAAAVEVALKSDLESINITADSALSSTSTNPVQNKVVNAAITNLNTLVGDTAVSTQISNAIATKADKTELPQIATAASSDGVAFTVTVPGITALTAGMSFVMIPSRASASTTPTLNVNGLGAKNLRRRLSSGATVVAGYTTTWITKNKPYRVMYDGSAWVVEGHNKPVAADLYGSVLPKVASATLTAANWTGTESPYSQTVVISGTTANSKIDLQPTVAQIVELQTAGTALMTENNSGTITVYAIGEKPTSDYTIQATITETTT